MLLSVVDEHALLDIELDLQEKNIKFQVFREPDRNDEITSIALIPCEDATKYCKKFKLLKWSIVVNVS